MKLPAQGIEAALTGDGESRRRRELRRRHQWWRGLGFEGERSRGSTRIRRGTREERRGGTGREDEWHVARLTRMDVGGRRVRAAPNRAERRERKGLTGGPRRDFYFLFLFFRAVTTLPPLRKSRPEI